MTEESTNKDPIEAELAHTDANIGPTVKNPTVIGCAKETFESGKLLSFLIVSQYGYSSFHYLHDDNVCGLYFCI